MYVFFFFSFVKLCDIIKPQILVVSNGNSKFKRNFKVKEMKKNFEVNEKKVYGRSLEFRDVKHQC